MLGGDDLHLQIEFAGDFPASLNVVHHIAVESLMLEHVRGRSNPQHFARSAAEEIRAALLHIFVNRRGLDELATSAALRAQTFAQFDAAFGLHDDLRIRRALQAGIDREFAHPVHRAIANAHHLEPPRTVAWRGSGFAIGSLSIGGEINHAHIPLMIRPLALRT
jgi:hypothetical protein